VVALVRPTASLWRLRDVLDDIELVEADLTELAPSTPSLRGVRVIHHLAAAGVDSRGSDASQVVGANVVGTLRLLEAARAVGVDRFVYCGSCFEYGAGSRLSEDAPLRPRSPYAASKSAGWLLAEAAATEGLPLVTLRLFTVYGPFEAAYRLVPSCVLSAIEGKPIEITRGDQLRDFVFVDDAIEAFVAASETTGVVGTTINVCSGVETRVRDLAAAVATLARSDAGVAVGSLPPRKGEADVLSGDPTRARRLLGFSTRTPLEEGLERSLAWFREHRALYQQTAVAAS